MISLKFLYFSIFFNIIIYDYFFLIYYFITEQVKMETVSTYAGNEFVYDYTH